MCTRGIIDPTKVLDQNKYGNSRLYGPVSLAKENVTIEKVSVGEIKEGNLEIKKGDILVATTLDQQHYVEYTTISSFLRTVRVTY